MASDAVHTPKAHLLSMPRELRDRIYDYLIFWDPVTIPGSRKVCLTLSDRGQYYRISSSDRFRQGYSSSDKEAHDSDDFVDSQIQLPINPSLAPSQICSRIRAEYHEHVAKIMRRAKPVTISVMVGGDAMGVPVPRRLSPSFMRLLPLLKEVRRLRVEDWPGLDWWNGTSAMELKGMVDLLLGQLRKVEMLEVEAKINSWDFWSWDVPVKQLQPVEPFLKAKMMVKGASLRYVERTLKVPADMEGAMRDTFLYRKVEELDPETELVQVVVEKALLNENYGLSELQYQTETYEERLAMA